MSKSLKSSKSSSSREDETNLINFSFCDHKSSFRHLLQGDDKYLTPIVEDEADFWKFANKYESMLRNAGQPILIKPLHDADMYDQETFHKRKYISLELERGTKWEQLRRGCHSSDENIFTKLRARQFREIVLTYLDFKQKEKFGKIKQLRKAQKSLPISRFKQKIEEELKRTRVLIIAGDTGCGKSTQVPQFLYEFGYRSIACTQPRRLACVSLSKRVAHEMLDDYGSKVGFQIRFEKNKTKNTNILFITEGLLLRQLAVETNLEQYDVLILDEIHERNLFGDFLLGVTKCLLHAKPELKLILMSATINVNLFYNYFENEGSALIEVPGRLYPIKTMFMPPASLELKGGAGGSKSSSKSSNRLDPAPYIQVLSLIDQKYPTTERGDVLIFVSGVNEIAIVCDAAKEYSEQNSHWIILPLHSGLALADQDKVFDYAPEGMRKCIVSTNIAETSLTVDGVRFVIDSGKVKEMSYDASCKGQRLKEFWVSKSSAEQRKGRAGRTGPGTCFRLFSEKQYAAFEAYPTPEIFRVPLETILLQMIAMGLPNVRSFPFIESPEEESIEQAIWSLKQHNALAVDEKITPLGRSLSNLPVEITIGKMLLMGCVFPDIEKILTLAATMSVQNPFTNRAYTDRKCEQEREPLQSDQGDIFTLLRAYNEWLELKWNNENTRKWCHKLGIEEQRFYEITKLRNQFQNILESCNMTCKNEDTTQLTSAERARRHGEVRQLRAMKRKQKYQEPRKRKILKHISYGGDEEFDDAAAGDDIRDVDFRLQHDAGKLEILLHSSKVDKLRDVLLLKLIIVSGFYPQIAIADEFNYCKSGSQQFFHTFLKPFISIHPNAYFAKYYDVLKLNDSDILDKPNYYTPKQLLSTRHQVLCYQNLLETAKPYLMNCIRMPAAQALLLFSYSVDTNASVTRIVCDSWLCLEFPVPETGCELLCRAIKLRRLWAKLLSQKLTDLVNNVESQSIKKEKSAKDEEGELWESLIDFMSVNVSYTIKRLLPADLKSLYTHIKLNSELLRNNPFASDYAISENDEKGGINVAENVVYGCLQEVQWTLAMEAEMRQHTWVCKTCETEMALDTIEKLLHKKACSTATAAAVKKRDADSPPTASTSKSGKGSAYFCETCQKELHISKIDILRHRKYCNRTDHE
ncbi:probable ATP-dependent RNA helicase DHX34 [Rhagoletis pomonella]|uniref:probable ATP-dependent RNA helicase DHX34 n=1 Tax=Rhagoletis pomonella TaxID=28610 RepID=UPI0017837266|nr:probable ATP-dependent RNA helicase DHX34 [Rhagoletis pomonella]